MGIHVVNTVVLFLDLSARYFLWASSRRITVILQKRLIQNDMDEVGGITKARIG